MITYSQRDKRWCDYIYSAKKPHNETIKSSGCGITSAAIIISNLTDKKVEPPFMADYAVKNNCRIDGVGTSFLLFKKIAKDYDLKCITSYNINDAKECVKRGGIVVCSTNGGKNKLFSTGGHLFLMTGYKDNICEFFDTDLYYNKYNTPYRRKRAKVKNDRVYVNINEAKKHITTYFLFERKEKMDKNIYSFDNTVEHMIRLHITDIKNMEHWEKCLNGEKELDKDEVRTIFDRFIKELYK